MLDVVTFRNVCGLALLAFGTVSAQQADLGVPPGFPKNPTSRATANAVPQASPGTWIDTSNRSAVQASYLTSFVPTKSVSMGWIGDLTVGNAGSTSQQYRDAVAARINWIRQLAGVTGGVTLSPTWNQMDQQAAMMMSVNRQLQHVPPATWQYYSSDGAKAAGNSNLCLGFSLSDPGCLEEYMQDWGDTNAAAGHRRWILYPQTQAMGTGDVAFTAGFPDANALWVIDLANLYQPRPATRDTYVAWPPPGYIPYQFVYPRWSFSYPGADFTTSVVTMTRGGASVPVRMEAQDQMYGENTLVWVPDNLNSSGVYTPTAPAGDLTTTVTVSNVSVGGRLRSFTYTVIVFDPNSYPSGTTFNFNPTSASFGPSGGSGSVALTVTPATTIWGALANSEWLSITANASGTGSGSIAYSVAPNTSSQARSGQITVGTSAFTVNQGGAPCSYTLSPGSASFGVSGGSGSITITPTPADCPISASFDPWVTVSFAGPILNFSVPANSGPARLGHIAVSGQAFTIAQAGSVVTLSGTVSGASSVSVLLNTGASAVTDGSGNYVFAGLAAGVNYTVSPAKSGYSFSPPNQTFANLSANQTANFSATGLTYSISGQVPGVTGAVVSLSTGGTTLTDSSGAYSFTGVPFGGTYIVRVSKAGYSFSPSSQTLANVSADQTANFSAARLSYSISGQVPGVTGVVVSLSTGATTLTDSSGTYAFAGLAFGGTYTVTVSKTGYSFSPPSQTFGNLTADQSANFTGRLLAYSISGQVPGLLGVLVSANNGASGITDAGGNYSIAGLPYDGTYTVTPSKSGYSFTPPSQTFTNLTSNQIANFSGSFITYTLSGTVAGAAGAIVTLSNGMHATTDASGNFVFTGLTPGLTYTVSASRSGFVVTPYTQTIPNLSSNRRIDFNAAPGLSPLPFGFVDTPAANALVDGSIGVTGWALDDSGVQKVDIWREPNPGEPTHPNGLVYLGDATQLAGARPDIPAAFPGYPTSERAGWGFLVLTNLLASNSGNTGVGNGVYRIHAIAHDNDGQTSDLGSKAVTVDNAHAITPFGAIDTPGQGETISGSAYVNFGWALAQPGKSIPTDGSTIGVVIDNVWVGRPIYNQYRSDVAGLFPGYANANGAVGYFIIDTTKLANGVHTIAWSVRDSAGNITGIGSRLFTVQN